MGDLRPPLDVFSNAFGTPAVVTPVGGGAMNATVIRITASRLAIQVDPTVANRRRFRLRRDEVASCPAGSTIAIASGPDAGTWRVDRVDAVDGEYLEVVVD